MKLNITLLFFIYFSNILISTAQELTITGQITDATNQAIEFANVLLQNKENKRMQYGTITDAKGSFQVTVTAIADYTITISFIGYSDWQNTLSISESIDLGTIELSPSVNNLDEVVVQAERNIITRKEDKLIFNVATSPLNKGYDGMEVLQRSPNVLVDLEGNILMRNEAPTIMINGRITNLSGADLTSYISNLRSEDIKAIEIQTHLSANTDAESSGGVINIILKQKPIGFDASLRSDYTFKGGGFNAAYSGLNFNYGAAKWNIYGSYNYLFEEGESTFINTTDYFTSQELIISDELFTNERKRHNYQVGFVADVADNQVLGIEGFATDYLYSFLNTGVVNIYQQGQLLENGQAVATNLIDSKLANATVNYKWTMDTLNSSFKIFADYAIQDATRTNDVASIYNQNLYPNLTERNIAPANTLIYSTQADIEKYFEQGLKLETGAKWTYTDRENTLLSDVLKNERWQATDRTTSYNYSEKVLAAYGALSKKLDSTTFLKLGLRVENTDLIRVDLRDNSLIEQNYINWFPTFYLSRELPKDKTLSLSYSKRLRRPSFHFLNNNVIKINDFRYELGNPDLIPELVNNWEISLKEKKQSLDIYLRRTTQAINGVYYLEGQIAYYQRFNEGIQQQLGVSYNRFGNLFSWWHLNGSLSVYQRKFINPAGADSFKRITTRVDMSNNFKINETTSIDVTGRYISRYEDAYYIAYERYIVNLMLQKFFFNKRLNCRLYLNDLFNTLNFRAERPFETFKTTRLREWRTRRLRLWLSYNFSGKNKVNKRSNQSKNDARRRL